MRIIALFICIPLATWSQSPVDATQFVGRALDAIQNGENQVADEVRFPWIEEYEFRTRTNDFDPDDQEYIFRISPSTSKKRKAQQDLYRGYASRPQFERADAFCSSVYEIYLDWLDLYLINRESSVLARMDSIYEDKETVFNRMIAAGDFELSELVRIQKDKSELAIRKDGLEADVLLLLSRHELVGRRLVFDGFMPVSMVKETMLIDAVNPEDISSLEIEYEIDLLDRELALEKAENRQYVDFLELRYEGPHSDMLEERLSLGIGLRIPNSGNRRLKMQELRLEQERLRQDQLRRQMGRDERLQTLRANALKDIGLYEYYVQTVEKEREALEKLARAVGERTEASPLLLLDIEERYVEISLELLDLSKDIYEGYLEYLYRSGRMCADPGEGFLSQP